MPPENANPTPDEAPIAPTDDAAARTVGKPHHAMSLREAIAQGDEGDFDFDPPRLGDWYIRPVDFD